MIDIFKSNLFSILILLVLILIMSISCNDVHINHKFKLINNSENNISVLYSNHETGELTSDLIDYYISDYNTIAPKDTFTITKLGKANAWHDYIQKGGSKKLYLFIFDIDTLKAYQGSYSMDELCEMKKYMKEIQYSERELIHNNWTVDFR